MTNHWLILHPTSHTSPWTAVADNLGGMCRSKREQTCTQNSLLDKEERGDISGVESSLLTHGKTPAALPKFF